MFFKYGYDMKLFIGNLPFSYSENDLKDLFSKYASLVSCKLIMNRETGRSKGFGFIEVSSNDEGNQAIKDLNGKDLDGRAIIVSEARPQTDRPERSKFSSRRY